MFSREASRPIPGMDRALISDVVAKSLASNRKREPPPLDQVRILVVEDDPSNRKLFSLLLAEAGALAEEAVDAEEALRKVVTFAPRIIIIDLILPRMSGLMLAHVLKTDPATQKIIAVAVSSIDGPNIERMALEEGFALFIRKPIDTVTFADTVALTLKIQA
jgi:CheY-like chemotaxis protein